MSLYASATMVLPVKVTKIEVALSVPSIEETVAWYERALGWKGCFDVFGEDGKCDYGSIFGGENCYFNLERTRPRDAPYPKGHPHVTLYINVDDVDAAYERVANSGWKVGRPPESQIWGGRTFTIRDLKGFSLMLLQMVEQPSLEEIRERLKRKEDEQV